MAVESLRLSLRFETAQCFADLALLAQAAERFPEVRLRLVDMGFDLSLDLGYLGGCFRFVYDEAASTARAGECVQRLELADGLAELGRAVRAGDFEGV